MNEERKGTKQRNSRKLERIDVLFIIQGSKVKSQWTKPASLFLRSSLYLLPLYASTNPTRVSYVLGSRFSPRFASSWVCRIQLMRMCWIR